MREEQLYERVLERIDRTRDTSDEELTDLIREVLQERPRKNIYRCADRFVSRQLIHFESWIFCRN